MPGVSAQRRITLPVDPCNEVGIGPGHGYRSFVAESTPGTQVLHPWWDTGPGSDKAGGPPAFPGSGPVSAGR